MSPYDVTRSNELKTKIYQAKKTIFTPKTITTFPPNESVIVRIYNISLLKQVRPCRLVIKYEYHYYRKVLSPHISGVCIYIYLTKCDPAALIYIIIGLFLTTNIFMYYSKCDPAALTYNCDPMIYTYIYIYIYIYYDRTITSHILEVQRTLLLLDNLITMRKYQLTSEWIMWIHNRTEAVFHCISLYLYLHACMLMFDNF